MPGGAFSDLKLPSLADPFFFFLSSQNLPSWAGNGIIQPFGARKPIYFYAIISRTHAASCRRCWQAQLAAEHAAAPGGLSTARHPPHVPLSFFLGLVISINPRCQKQKKNPGNLILPIPFFSPEDGRRWCKAKRSAAVPEHLDVLARGPDFQ
jgi:hypothetical protein